jgi:RNA polymerase sigma factor (sigma-70 family)
VEGAIVLYSEPEISQDAKRLLLECIQENMAALLGSIRLYVRRMGLTGGVDVQMVALEILQEVVVEALEHADRFSPERQPLAWLLGIAINVIKRKKVEMAKRERRELLFGRLVAQQSDDLSESDLLDQVGSSSLEGPEQALETDEQVNAMLSLVSEDDQQVLRLALIEGFKRESLAQQLGISVGATRMKLHRALSRLRAAWFAQQQTSRKGEYDA